MIIKFTRRILTVKNSLTEPVSLIDSYDSILIEALSTRASSILVKSRSVVLDVTLTSNFY